MYIIDACRGLRHVALCSYIKYASIQRVGLRLGPWPRAGMSMSMSTNANAHVHASWWSKYVGLAEKMTVEYDRLSQTPLDQVLDKDAHFKRLAELEPLVGCWKEWLRNQTTLEQLHGLIHEETGQGLDELRAMAKEEAQSYASRQAELVSLLKRSLRPKEDSRMDPSTVVMELRAGTGGLEATHFCLAIWQMYLAYVERLGWHARPLSLAYEEGGGLREAIVQIHSETKNVYDRLKYESGVHRVQRVPATDASGRVHTSTMTVSVLPCPAQGFDSGLGLDAESPLFEEKDIRVDTYRASGPGGQHVNTTNSAVRVTHLPTGLAVAVQDERSQPLNKARALAILQSRLYVRKREALLSEQRLAKRSLIGSASRHEKIRTYNYPQARVTDHRIGFSIYDLTHFMAGHLDEMIDALETENDLIEDAT